MHELFRSVIWPAVAGNVAWSFFSVITAEKISDGEVFARLISLGLIAIYLMISWVWKSSRHERSKKYYILDSLFASSIAVFAIATQNQVTAKEMWVSITLILVFVFPMTGHICAILEPRRPTNERLWLAMPTAIGIFLLLVGLLFFPRFLLDFNAGSLSAVILLWILLRRHLAKGSAAE